MKNLLFIIIVIVFNYFIGIYAENSYYIVNILRDKSDKNYDDESEEIQQLTDNLLNERMNDIYHIIENNQDTYVLENGKQDEKLEELNNSPLRKRNENGVEKKLLFINKRKSSSHSKRSLELLNTNNSTVEYVPFESELVNYGCPIKNYYAIAAYLSEEIVDEVCHLENVLYCEKSETLKVPEVIKKTPIQDNNNNNNKKENDFENKKSNYYYDIDAIQKETNWTSVSVQPTLDEDPYTYFLSFISQSNDIDEGKPLDMNYYYPSSAGHGIDMYFIDSGIIVHPDYFDTYKDTEDERTVTCDAISNGIEIRDTTEDEKTSCMDENFDYPAHGIEISSVGGGSLLGVAKKANIHMIASNYSSMSILRAIDYIILNAKPHKTILNISFGSLGMYHKSYDDKLSDLINSGIIVVDAVGNDGVNVCGDKYSDTFGAFAGCRKAIAVGAIDSDDITSIDNKKYHIAHNSNFGDCIDIFAPGDVIAPYLNSYSPYLEYIQGTSFSAPIVAGVAATIMSEHPEIKFDNEMMRQTLIDMSIKDAIVKAEKPLTYSEEDEMPDPFDKENNTPNRFINNGKRSVYIPREIYDICGGPSGIKCSDGCCSKDGECISYNDGFQKQCLIENGCQNEFGQCFTMEYAIKECENELNEYKECQMEIGFKSNFDSNLYDENILNSCKIFNTEKCQEFYQNQISNQSACSFINNKKSFKFIDHFSLEMYNDYQNNCDNILNYHSDECYNSLPSENYCLIDTSYKEYIDFDIEKECLKFKSEKCINNKSNLNEIFKNNLSCSLFEKYGEIEVYSDLGRIVYNRNNYEEINDYCDKILINSTDKCDEVLKEYEECVDFSFEHNKNDYNEFVNTCGVIHDKCKSLFEDGLSEKIPICYNAKQYKQYDLLDELEKTQKDYHSYCKENISEEFIEKSIADCNKEIELNFNFEIIVEDTKLCKVLQSKDNKKNISIIDNIPVCNLALSYNSYNSNLQNDSFIISIININQLDYCKNDYDITVEKCAYTLKPKYAECIFDNEPKNENEFYYQCLFFTEEYCQQFYHEPLSEECSMLKKTNSYLFLDPLHPKWQYYNENCQKIIDSRRITKSIESTTTKSEETTTSNSNQPTSAKSEEDKTSNSNQSITTTTKSKKHTTTKSKKHTTTKSKKHTTTKSKKHTITKSKKHTTTKSKKHTTKSKKYTTIKSVKPIKKVLTTKFKKVKTTNIKKVKTTKKLVVIKKPKTTKKNIKKTKKVKKN